MGLHYLHVALGQIVHCSLLSWQINVLKLGLGNWICFCTTRAGVCPNILHWKCNFISNTCPIKCCLTWFPICIHVCSVQTIIYIWVQFNKLLTMLQLQVLQSFKIMDYSLLLGVHNLDISIRERVGVFYST